MDAIGLADQPGASAGASMTCQKDLIARARGGDQEAFRHIFERYTRPVISFIFYMVNRRELAEELAQETFARAYRHIRTLRDTNKLSTWLFGIAKNVAREHLRSEGRESRNVEIDHSDALKLSAEHDSPVERLLDKELQAVMLRALATLDEDKRLVFTLKVYQQCSYEEISEITGFSMPKIRNDLSRARAELRRRLSRYMGIDYEM